MSLKEQKQIFGTYAKDYQKYRRYYNPKVYKTLGSLSKKIPSQSLSVLDVACGTGKSTEPLTKLPHSTVFGIDADNRMLNEAKASAERKHLSITYTRGIAEKLPFKSGSFDVITVATAFHWFATKQALREFKRVLKPGGLIFVYWSMEKKTARPTLGQSLYKQYVWKAVPKKNRDTQYISKIFRESNLKSVKVVKIIEEKKYTAKEYVGGLKTSSMYALMNKRNQDGFSRDMFKAFKNEVRGKFYKIQSEMFICYGFKK